MRRVHATKRETYMSERKLLFLMTAAQEVEQLEHDHDHERRTW
jgi:hypothetical protein